MGPGGAPGETVEVTIPAGVDTGVTMRVQGRGPPSPDGRRGDLLLQLDVTGHQYFKRDGSDIHTEVPLTVYRPFSGARSRSQRSVERWTSRFPRVRNPARWWCF